MNYENIPQHGLTIFNVDLLVTRLILISFLWKNWTANSKMWNHYDVVNVQKSENSSPKMCTLRLS